jgi:hypothetical protein
MSQKSQQNSWMPPSLLPPMSGWLLLGFLIFYPVVLLGAKQFIPALIFQAEALTQGKGITIPLHFILKMLIFTLLGGGGLLLLRLRLDVAYISHWAKQFPRPHPLHVDYHPAEPYSLYALGRWVLYRFLRIGTVPVLLGLAIALSLWLQLLFLNTFLEAPFMKWPVVYIVGIFWMLTLGLLFMASLVNAVWQSLGSTFGVCAVVSEPMKAQPILFNRCQRLSIQTLLAWPLYGLKLLLHLLWLSLSVWLLWHYNVKDLFTLVFPWWWVLPSLVGLWLAEVCLGFARFSIYHVALQNFYQQLPRFVKDAFQPPASIFETPLWANDLTPSDLEAPDA